MTLKERARKTSSAITKRERRIVEMEQTEETFKRIIEEEEGAPQQPQINGAREPVWMRMRKMRRMRTKAEGFL
jgi:hypothetical protein